MALIQNRRYQLCSHEYKGDMAVDIIHTYLRRSSPSASCLTRIVFLSIFAMMFSRNTTISCPKNFMRHGLVAKCTFGTLFLMRDTKNDNRGRRGRVAFLVISSGPGTNTKCVWRVIIG